MFKHFDEGVDIVNDVFYIGVFAALRQREVLHKPIEIHGSLYAARRGFQKRIERFGIAIRDGFECFKPESCFFAAGLFPFFHVDLGEHVREPPFQTLQTAFLRFFRSG